jgi:PST family polysaccharide transporter
VRPVTPEPEPDGSGLGHRPSIGQLRSLAQRGLVRNFAALLVAEVVTRSSSIVSVALIARLVGAPAMGYLALAQALSAFAYMLGDGGITTLAQRQIAARHDSAASVATLATVGQVMLGTLAVAVFGTAALVLPLPPESSRLLIVLLPVVLAQAVSLVYVLQALERMRSVAAVKVVTQVTTAGLGLALVFFTRDVLWVAVATTVGIVAGDLLSAWILIRVHRLRPVPPSIERLGAMIAEGSPFLGITLLTQVLLQLDIIVLGFLRPAAEVGYYTGAYRLVLFVFTLSGLLSQAAFPQLVRRYVEDGARFQRLLRLLVRLAAHFTLPVTAMFIVESPSIIRAVFGPEFAPSSDIMRILALWIPLGFYNSVVAIGLIAGGQQRRYLGIAAAGAVITAGLLVVLVPAYGGLGAAAAVVVREAGMLVLFSIAAATGLATDTVGVFLRQSLWLVVPLAALVALNAVLPNLSLFASLGLVIASVIAIEWLGGWGLYRDLLGIRTSES